MNNVTRLSSSVVNFDVFNLPPYTRIAVQVGGVDHSSMCVNDDGTAGDPLVSDGTGRIKGKLILNKWWSSYTSGDIQITFGSSETATNSFDPPIYAIANLSNRLDNTLTSGGKVVAPTNAAGIQEATTTLSPVTQTFFVPERYSQGIVITSIELFFATKDSELPVSVELRRLINGLPSAGTVITDTTVAKNPSEVNVPADPNSGIGSSTKFSFPPVYLAPGEYSFSVLSNSPNYTLFAGKLGETILGSTAIVSKEPYTGRLFKAQNTNQWLEETNTDICFKINKAKFQTGVKSFELQTAAIPRTEIDNIFLDTAQYNFGDLTKIDYEVKGIRWSDNAQQSYVSFKEKTPFNLIARWVTENVGDSKIQVTFTNNSTDVSPAIDKARTKLYSFKNLIDPFEVDTRASELQYNNGVAQSKYISKIVTLEDGFDSTGIEVKLDVNRKTGTDIDVFCRVISSADNGIDSSIEKKNWRVMPLFNQTANAINESSISGSIGKKYVGSSETEFKTETYKILEGDSLVTTGTPNLSYTSNVGTGAATTFTSFNKFQVKVVFYSGNPTIVPKIKNLIATAVI